MVDPLLVWIAFGAPLVACVVITLFFLNSKSFSSLLAIAGILTSFVCTSLAAVQIFHTQPPVEFQQSFTWIQFDTLTINFGFLVNPLSIMMLLMVTGVGSAIFIYSKGYMAKDPGLPRFFAFLSLFAFSMIGIVLANNLMELFICWELVGLSSYLVIGFWYEKPSAADAGVKAFMVNRLADFGLLCGILLLWSLSDVGGGKSFELTQMAAVIPHLNPQVGEWVALLFFCGVIGKSAQVPLHVWLPDAMEGPTPVSALIHAATMVAAGVYLLARLFFIFEPATGTLAMIAGVGALTALLTATLAVVENDIKRILAYSTISQLGLMVMALGLSGPMQGMYHLITHAFFKALLFLAVDFSSDPIKGGVNVDRSGDWAPDNGDLTGTRKRCLRRVLTAKNSFVHLQGYGLDYDIKQPATNNKLASLRTDAQGQLAQEPDVASVATQISMDVRGLLSIGFTAKTKTGQNVPATLQATPDGVTLR